MERLRDGLGAAERLLWMAAAVTVIALSLLVLDPLVRPRVALLRCAAVVQALHRSQLTLVPSGRGARQPQALHRAVDLRATPLLLPYDPSSEGLVIDPSSSTQPSRSAAEGKR